jgi:hypothetical protein
MQSTIFAIVRSNRLRKSPKSGLIPTPSQKIRLVLFDKLAL